MTCVQNAPPEELGIIDGDVKGKQSRAQVHHAPDMTRNTPKGQN